MGKKYHKVHMLQRHQVIYYFKRILPGGAQDDLDNMEAEVTGAKTTLVLHKLDLITLNEEALDIKMPEGGVNYQTIFG
jgi:hypothetical protein